MGKMQVCNSRNVAVLVLAGIYLIFFIEASMGYVLDLCWK